MKTKDLVIEAAYESGFADVGFTTADPFDTHREFLLAHAKAYDWAPGQGLDLVGGTDPKQVMAQAKSVIVLLEVYLKAALPRELEAHFGRCYLDDDRVTRDGLYLRIKQFREALRGMGIDSKVPPHLPQRMAAARAGLGTFGKNGLFYASRVGLQSSWNLPIAVVVDHEFEPDDPGFEMGCPQWCRNACIAACPTRALQGSGRVDPKKCISYLSYFETGITPMALREPMGLSVYGCDRCQNVCPRNAAWLARKRPENKKVAALVEDFSLPGLLHMDRQYYEQRIWPHMFYIPSEKLWLWQMNAARVMGNTLDPDHVPDLVRAFGENPDERVRGMSAWALGRIGGRAAEAALNNFFLKSTGPVKQEAELALAMIRRRSEKTITC